MKTLKKIMMAMFAIATIGMTVACQKSDSTDDGHGDINASIVGTWKVERALLNDNIIPGETVNMNIIMNDDGTGKLESNVAQLPIADSLFDWGLNGTTLTIRMNGGQTLSYTVTKLTATECTIQGTVVPGFPTMTLSPVPPTGFSTTTRPSPSITMVAKSLPMSSSTTR